MQHELAEVKTELKRISDTLVRNTALLETHILRTEHAEKRLDHIESFNKWWLSLMVSAIIGVLIKLIFR